ncbi:MAG: hypothetical protein KGL19_03705 [Bacteroidota bacterium]|nr:hypothetical protein [Bacteroidota bacterium]
MNHKVGLPGVGNFYIESVPAKLDIVHCTLDAPFESINFSSDAPVNDRAFYDYLSREMKLNGIEAVAQFNELSKRIQETAAQNAVALPGIGTLKKNESGEFIFYPEIKSNSVLQQIHLNNSVAADANIVSVYDSGETKIITQEAIAPEEEKILMSESEDYWWVYAIILALMGLGALLYYYI